MEISLHDVILTEGAALYRDIRGWKNVWHKSIQGDEGATAPAAGPPPPLRSMRRSSPLHGYYPFLFHALFPEVPLDSVRELARADRLYTEHLLAYDRTLDRQEPMEPAALFLAQLEHMHSLKRLYVFFPVGHPFWTYFRDSYFETWKSLREERLCHSHRIGAFSFSRFCTLAKGKTAALRSFSLALAFLSNRTGTIHRLSGSLDRHHVALVLIDDLEDWRQDFQSGNFTYLLTRLIRDAGMEDEIRSGRPVSPDRVGRLLYTSGRMEKHLRLAEVFFQKSIETVGDLSLPLWKRFNNGFRARCRALRFDLAEIRRREEMRARIRAANERRDAEVPDRHTFGVIVSQIRAGVRFLAGSRTKGGAFPLSASPHSYMCPSKPVAASRSITTLVLRALEPIKALDSTVIPLLRSARLGLRNLDDTGPSPGLPTALEGAFQSVSTDPDQLSRMDRGFAPHYGPLRDGLHWANFLFTCSRNGFRPPRLTAYVADCLRRQWYTPWTFGAAFGPVASPWTRYMCKPLLPLVLICQALGRELPVEALQNYLLAPCGSGLHGHNTTETALVLLCLAFTGYDGPEPAPAISRLSESQEPDGSWAPNAIYREGSHYYGSRELTTAWCLEALTRYRGWARKGG